MIEALFIGNECCDGRVLNTNQQFLGEKLYTHGFFLSKSVTVSDDEADLLSAIQAHLATAEILITTGGLGPTEDDRTTRVLAQACGIDLKRDEGVVAQIKNYFESTGRNMPDENTKQADFPEGSTVLDNPFGTAPGFYFPFVDKESGRTVHIFCCPGVPKEMKPMFVTHILPKLETLIPHLKISRRTALFRCFGAGESHCAERIRDIYPLPDGASISFQVKFPEIQIRLHCTDSVSESKKDELVETIGSSLDKLCFSRDGSDSLAGLIVKKYAESNQTIALAESCTGGRIAAEITGIPGASVVLDRSVVVYSNQSKSDLLGVEDKLLAEKGAVSSEVAEAMADGIRKQSGADIGVSVTGIAGPDGGTEEKPVGTVYFGVATESGTRHFLKSFSGDRERVQVLSSWVGLDCLNRLII